MENSYNTVNHGVMSFQPPLLSERKSEDRSTRGVDYYNRNGNLRLPLTCFFAIAFSRDWSILQIQSDKCEFLKPELEYLGHVVTKEGVKPNPKKTQTVKDFKIKKTATHIKSYLGFVGYYRKFIRNFSKIAKPLTDLTKKNTPFHWADNQQLAFDTLKQKLYETPVLQYSDFEKTFTSITDV